MNFLNVPTTLRAPTRRGMFTLTAVLTAASLGGLAGCDDTEPNDDGGMSLDGGDSCIETERIVDLDEASDLGFTAQDVLDLVAGEHQSELTWSDESLGSSPTGITNITYSLDTANPSKVIFVSSEPNPDSQVEIEADCRDRLVIELAASVQTDDGVLAETFEVALASDDGELADWRGWLEPADIEGTFSKEGDDDFEFTGLEISGNHSASSVSGQVGMELQSRGDAPDGIAAFGLIGSWGSPDDGI